jgi:hypothetical protein
MGYRDEFYIAENIVGYTGQLGVNPTVYFETPEEVGRITQAHPNPKNVGRNTVRKMFDYTVDNILLDGFFHAQEAWETATGKKGSHRSRNPIFNEHVTNFERSRLALAIKRFPDLKPKSQ